MDRAEEIQKAANLYAGGLIHRDGFVSGANWADNNPKSLWVNINVRLPKKGEEFLAQDKNGLNSLYIRPDDSDASDDEAIGFFRELGTDLWLPIPNLPKGGEQ